MNATPVKVITRANDELGITGSSRVSHLVGDGVNVVALLFTKLGSTPVSNRDKGIVTGRSDHEQSTNCKL